MAIMLLMVTINVVVHQELYLEKTYTAMPITSELQINPNKHKYLLIMTGPDLVLIQIMFT